MRYAPEHDVHRRTTQGFRNVRAVRTPRGASLLELLVVLVVLGILLGVSVVAFRITPPSDAMSPILDARRRAIMSGRAVVGRDSQRPGAPRYTALPDGQVVMDAPAPIERLTGVSCATSGCVRAAAQ